MEKLLELYLKVVEFPSGCQLTSNQKSVVLAFIREANKHVKQNHPLSICKRKPVIDHVKKLFAAHGLV